MPEIDQSTKLFNTAVIATKIPKSEQGSARLNSVLGSAQFQAILKAVQLYSKENNVSEELACEEIIRTFRTIDEIWNDYIFQAGLSKLRGTGVQKNTEQKQSFNSTSAENLTL